jgi:GNAT superfamily N-acetyltransferase
MRAISRLVARDAIRATLAADAACAPADFDGDRVTVVEYRSVGGRRRFEEPAKPFVIISMGHGVVVACHREWLEWARARASELDRDRFLGAANLGAIADRLSGAGCVLYGPLPSYACSVDTLRPFTVPSGVTIEVVRGDAIDPLRPNEAFRHALPPEPEPMRPDRLAVIARVDADVVACAAASEENDQLCQVGVDVLPPWRGRGVGRAVVGPLTEAVLAEGRVPYYCHVIANIPSAALATSLGYWPAWVQWHARETR